MLQLLYLHFTQPRRDQALFDTYVGRVKPALLGERNNPSRMFGDFYVRQLFNNHPRAVGLPSDAQINALNMDAMLAIQQTHFSNANGFRFALVGSFDEAKIIPLLTRYIGGLPSNTSIEFGVQHNGMRPVLGQQRIHFAKGKEAKSQGSIMFHGNAKYNPGSGMDLYLLEKVLQICLTEVLREQLSGAYSVGVSSTFSRVPYGNYSLSISIPSSPEKLESLMQTAKEVVADLVENGPNADDLQKAKAAYRTQRLVWEKENSFWLNNLLIYDAEGRDLRDIPSFSSQHVERASVKSLQKAAKKFLSGENRFESVFDPEPTAAKP
jgi:zinc protease